eukprot:TRINITY_DN16742_c0_g2_i1.p2 TRINITY_DN16742_c0_g2~~TRINITY_DN16742_c0_g2_i1.p2  ORF type:complete len:137 (-),score=51.20 TRINITY_DN16742_c0_g2_i1:125-535(-)
MAAGEHELARCQARVKELEEEMEELSWLRGGRDELQSKMRQVDAPVAHRVTAAQLLLRELRVENVELRVAVETMPPRRESAMETPVEVAENQLAGLFHAVQEEKEVSEELEGERRMVVGAHEQLLVLKTMFIPDLN